MMHQYILAYQRMIIIKLSDYLSDTDVMLILVNLLSLLVP